MSRGFGRISEDMETTLRHYVEGQVVWDLGAGHLIHAKHLLRLGAVRIMAVDKEGFRASLYRGFNIVPIRNYYANMDLTEDFEVVFLSWPTNTHLGGLVSILERAQVVIYLGCNTGGSCCGWSGLFRHFRDREVLATHTIRQNTMTVYGPEPTPPRPPTGEEWVMLNGQPLLTFEEAEERALVSWKPSKHSR